MARRLGKKKLQAIAEKLHSLQWTIEGDYFLPYYDRYVSYRTKNNCKLPDTETQILELIWMVAREMLGKVEV